MEISRRKMLLGGGALGAAGALAMASPAGACHCGPGSPRARSRVRGGRGPALGVGRAGRSAGRAAARPGRRAPGQPAAQVVDLQLPTAAGRAPRRRAGIREQARQLPSWVDHGKLQTAGDYKPGALPRPPVRVRQRHDELCHPQRGPRRLLLQGRLGHAGPHHQDGQARARHRRPERLSARRRHGGDRGQDPHGARGGATPAAAVAGGPRSVGGSRSRSARPTSW